MFRERYKKYYDQIHPDQSLMNKVIQSVQDEGNEVSMKKKYGRRWAAAAAVIVLVTGGTVYAGSLMKQIHVQELENQEQLINKAKKENWETVPEQGKQFDESIYDDIAAEALLDRVISGVSEDAVMENGTENDLWLRKLTNQFAGDDAITVVYDYARLSDAFADHNLGFNMAYIESNYPIVSGEYGCDYCYSLENPNDCQSYRMFSGYSNGTGKFVGVEYKMDYIYSNEDAYTVASSYDSVGYYTTSDGVEVLLEKATGTKGGKRVDAAVYTKYGSLWIIMYGDFTDEEVEAILDSLQISEGMGIAIES